MNKLRIIEREFLDGSKRYLIQYRKFFVWLDAKYMYNCSSGCTPYYKDTFDTFKEAKDHFKYFSGEYPKDKVVK